ncbi:MAG TPA: metallophosphoesterase family protein [Opitutaceae bacterium]
MTPRHLIALACLTLTVPCLQANVTVVRGPYLQQATPESMVIRWRTDVAEESVVRYGTEKDALTERSTARGLVTEHVVQLAGLKPGTRYYYRVAATPPPEPGKADPGARGAVYSFVTPPIPGPSQPTRVWVLGDPGTRDQDQIDVRDAYHAFNKDRSTDLWLMLGDNAYNSGTDAEYQGAVFDMYRETLRTSPLWPALGNHDAGTANSITQSGVYYDIFTLPTRGQAGGVPSGTEAYYSFDYANIHFICLDSHDSDRSADGAMAQWLKADLAATQRDWIIAFFHHPTYTKGTHDSDKDDDSGGRMNDMRRIFLPILEQGDVDLVLTGHSHVYERSPLIDGHYGKSDTFNATVHIKQGGDGRAQGGGVYRKNRQRTPHSGEVSIVAGSSGHASSKPVPLNHPAMLVSLNEIGSVVIDVDALRLDLTFIDGKAAVRDSFTLIKQ